MERQQPKRDVSMKRVCDMSGIELLRQLEALDSKGQGESDRARDIRKELEGMLQSRIPLRPHIPFGHGTDKH